MFSYFNRDENENEMKYTVPYKERLEKRTTEICKGINCSEEDMLNLEALARMSVPKDDLNIEKIKSISKFSEDYEEYIRARFFRGLSPEEFENDEKLMLEFNMIKSQVKKDFMNKTEKHFSFMVPIIGENLEEYAKRVIDIIDNMRLEDGKHLNIEKSYVIDDYNLTNLLAKSRYANVINEELVDIVALIETISNSKELLLKISENYDQEFKILLNNSLVKWYNEAILLIYGYYMMHDNDIYDLFNKYKNAIYAKFGNTYNSELFKKHKRDLDDTTKDADDYNLEDTYTDYDTLSNREKMIKPIYNPGVYATFYSEPDNMWNYLYCKQMSSSFAEIISEYGIENFASSLSHTLKAYSGTEDEKTIRNAICGIPKVLRRKNKKISNKKIKEIEKTLKSI